MTWSARNAAKSSSAPRHGPIDPSRQAQTVADHRHLALSRGGQADDLARSHRYAVRAEGLQPAGGTRNLFPLDAGRLFVRCGSGVPHAAAGIVVPADSRQPRAGIRFDAFLAAAYPSDAPRHRELVVAQPSPARAAASRDPEYRVPRVPVAATASGGPSRPPRPSGTRQPDNDVGRKGNRNHGQAGIRRRCRGCPAVARQPIRRPATSYCTPTTWA